MHVQPRPTLSIGDTLRTEPPQLTRFCNGSWGSFFEFAIGFVTLTRASTGNTPPYVLTLPSAGRRARRTTRSAFYCAGSNVSVPSQVFHLSPPPLFELFVHFLPNCSFRSKAIYNFTVHSDVLEVKNRGF